MDLNVDPCDDFYSFACGGWIKRNPRPRDKDQWQALDILRSRAKTRILANLEMRDADGIDGLKLLLRKIGGFPLIDKNWKDDKYDWQKAYIELASHYSEIRIFFYIDSTIDPTTNFTSKILKIRDESPDLGMDLVNSELSRHKKADIEKDFRFKAEESIVLLNGDLEKEEIATQVDEIIEFEIRLALAFDKNERWKHVSVSFKDLKKEVKIDLAKIIAKVFDKVNIKINETADVKIRNPEYFRKLSEILNIPKRKDFSPTVVNAFYSPWSNTIEVSSGILQPPIYYTNSPIVLNYGAIGVIIGHEITHGFDDTGALYDEQGRRTNWWANETREKYEEKVKCFVDQYSSYTEPKTGAKVNGSFTIGDNIADNGGLQQAFMAYKIYSALNVTERDRKLPGDMEQFSKEQLFFISYANVTYSKLLNFTPKK
ncbi:endothelin-converting enzyme 1-like protein [Dinothrombium tinctorium]|uniref:Endothelin-converting enzyme 1-like protein n=1 Tax=Dinothrombium tinctorium TaxID=1965070 RepID=A0A443RGN7_9ACAR|nr:endothelin-converting enzyme 1-like protein [Dinothrombium tinctorium]